METWLTDNDAEPLLERFQKPFCVNRNGRAGGVCCYIADDLAANCLWESQNFEALTIAVRVGNQNFHLTTWYSASSRNKAEYLYHLASILEKHPVPIYYAVIWTLIFWRSRLLQNISWICFLASVFCKVSQNYQLEKQLLLVRALTFRFVKISTVKRRFRKKWLLIIGQF